MGRHAGEGEPFKGEHLSSPLSFCFFVYWFVSILALAVCPGSSELSLLVVGAYCQPWLRSVFSKSPMPAGTTG